MKKVAVNKLIDDFKEEIESWIKVVSKRSFKDGYKKGYDQGFQAGVADETDIPPIRVYRSDLDRNPQ